MKRVLATRPDVQGAEKATQPTVVHFRKPRRETPSASADFALVAAAGAGFAAAAAATPLTAFDRGAGAACTPAGPVAGGIGGGGRRGGGGAAGPPRGAGP